MPDSKFIGIQCIHCNRLAESSYYTVLHLSGSDGKESEDIDALRGFFGDTGPNIYNFVLFSTSGIHGWYGTLDEIEASIIKHGLEPPFPHGPEDETPDDWLPPVVTFLIVSPRTVTLRCGNVRIESMEDLKYLKQLRESSWKVMQEIGR